MASRFREHLSIYLTTANIETDKPKILSNSFTTSSVFVPSKYAGMPASQADLESGIRPQPRSFRDRVTNFFVGSRHTDMHVSSQHSASAPACRCEKSKKERKRTTYCFVSLGVVMVWLTVNVIILNVRVFSSTSSSNTLAPDAQFCLLEFMLNAPSEPSSYPCSTCSSIFQGIPSDFSFSSSQDAQQVQDATQFCGLTAIYNEANADGQASLGNNSWVQNVNFCTWTGVTCDTSGRVSSLELTYPAVPTVLPADIGSLTALSTLKITGGDQIPAGSLPNSFMNLTSLTDLFLEGTAVTAFPDDIFESLKAVTTLNLVANTLMGSSLPTSIVQLSLKNLVINSEGLDNPLTNITTSPTLQSSLQLLDLSTTGITGVIPSSISSLESLTQLLLTNNDLQSPLPLNFPPKLQIISLANNTALTGTVPPSLCSLSSLTSCSLQDTGLNVSGTCGSCQLS